jgi:hypothetical protein
MKVSINLGRPRNEMYGAIPQVVGGDEVAYPKFHYSGPEELDLPQEGDMVICFRKVRETSEVKQDGSHWYECDVEVRSIESVEGEDVEPPTRRDTSAEDNLDRLMKEHMDEEGDEDAKESY